MPASKKPTTKKAKVVKTAKKVKVAPKKIAKVGSSQMKGFLEFIRTQGVIGLAVGLVIGGAVAVLVKSLVNNVVMPPIGLLLGSAEGLNGLTWTIGSASGGKQAVLHYGVFLNDFVNFLVIALVIYFIIHLLKLDKLDKPKS
ncbi:MAG: MscL family protein [Candidatus Saccharibacteria bacterium]|nr:MscL family protein [Candidatus Saccharibacteria bacterium]